MKIQRARSRAGMLALLFSAAVIAAAIHGAAGLTARAADDERDRRREMTFGNYESLMKVMFQLSQRQYYESVKELRTIEKHAEILSTSGSRPTLFHSYARSLKAHAANLRELAESLGAVARDNPELDFLHDAAAADFGQIAATCVACHGHFLPVRN